MRADGDGSVESSSCHLPRLGDVPCSCGIEHVVIVSAVLAGIVVTVGVLVARRARSKSTSWAIRNAAAYGRGRIRTRRRGGAYQGRVLVHALTRIANAVEFNPGVDSTARGGKAQRSSKCQSHPVHRAGRLGPVEAHRGSARRLPHRRRAAADLDTPHPLAADHRTCSPVARACRSRQGHRRRNASRSGDRHLAVDPDRLQQIAWQFLPNAIVYADDGQVSVTLDCDHHVSWSCPTPADSAKKAPCSSNASAGDSGSTRPHGGVGLASTCGISSRCTVTVTARSEGKTVARLSKSPAASTASTTNPSRGRSSRRTCRSSVVVDDDAGPWSSRDRVSSSWRQTTAASTDEARGQLRRAASRRPAERSPHAWRRRPAAHS